MKNGYRHLGRAERRAIETRLRRGESLRAVAKALGRSHSTLVRELQRNGGPRPEKYRRKRAQAASEKRRSRASRRPRLKTRRLRAYVARQLSQGWSPERIARRVSELGWEESISHEAIYQWLRGRDLHRF